MDPLSITASAVVILQIATASGKGVNKLISLKDAPLQLQQLSNEAEALRALLLQTEASLHRRSAFEGYDRIKASIIPVLQTVKAHVLEFEQLIHLRLSREDVPSENALPKVNRSYWLRAAPEIQRVKQNIQDARTNLKDFVGVLGLDDSFETRTGILQIQSISLSNQAALQEVKNQQKDLYNGFQQMGQSTYRALEETQNHIKQREADMQQALIQMRIEQNQGFAAIQTCITTSMHSLQLDPNRKLLSTNGNPSAPGTDRSGPTVQISASLSSQQCSSNCRCMCHFRSTGRSPQWLKGVVGQMMWNYNSSVSLRNCDVDSCRRSLSKHNFTYRFPSWLLSRALVASVNLENLPGAGAKISINVPLIVPEEDHIVWSLVIAGNVEQLREILKRDGNLMYVKNQWGQSIMHVAAKVHQPTVFNFLLALGMDPHSTDENYKSAATTVMTRRGSNEYDLSLDVEDLSDRLSWSELHRAAALTREGHRITEELLKAGFDDLNSRDALGRTPLHWLAENGEADAIRVLTQDPWRADAHTRDNAGFTALHCACWADDVESAAVLLQAGADPNARDKHKRTPLMHFDSCALLELTLGHGADVYISDDEGCNIMHHVSVSDQADLARILLERYGHQLFAKNYNGDTPLTEAVQNNSVEMLAVLLPYLEDFPAETIAMQNNKKRNALHLAALHASTEAMEILASVPLIGLDADAKDKDGHTPNECFIRCRDAHCAVTRESFEKEKQAWTRLMKSARGESDNLFGVVSFKAEGGFHGVMKNSWMERKDSVFAGSTMIGSDSESDADFVDAEEEHYIN